MGCSSSNRGGYGYNIRGNQRYGRNNNNRRGNYRNQHYNRNRSRRYESQSRNRRNNRSVSNSRFRSGSTVSTNRDGIKCFECREYDHFASICPTRQASRETEQIQQLFYMGKDQTILQTPLMDTDESPLTITLMEARDNLNL